jgi:propionyl-CoA carboxylase alpha chain
VTELVTGLDLVELMIRIAAGEPLPFTQKDLRLEGAAIEARIYAEDPFRNFLPSIGRLVHYQPPVGDGIRIDSGVFEGAEISIYYDPMIAKLIAFGATRAAAIQRLAQALDAFHIAGVAHNIPFLAAVIGKERFRAGALSTSFIAQEFPAGFAGEAIGPADQARALAVAAAAQFLAAEHEARIGGQVAGRATPAPESWIVCRGEERHAMRTRRAGDAIVVIAADGMHRITTSWQPWQPVLDATMDGVTSLYQVTRAGIGMSLARAGWRLELQVLLPRAADFLALMPERLAEDLSHLLLSPMPGLLVSLAVSEGQEVKSGQEVAVIEAMKMENVLRAHRDGKIAKLHAKAGDSLTADQVILEFA